MPRVSPLHSQVAFRSQFSGAVFNIADFERFSRVMPGPRVLSGSNAHFVPPFSVFRLADPVVAGPPESFARADAQ